MASLAASLGLDFNDLLGTLMLGTWVCSMLYAIILKETWFYFNHFPRDAFLLKLIVAVVVFGDTVCLAATYATVYLYSVSHWGDLSYLTKQYWPIFTFLMTTGIITTLVQGFLIVRYFTLSRNWFFLIFIFMLIGLALATCEATAVIFILWPDYAQRHRSKVTVITWLSSSAATDVGISLALIWQLRSIKTSFAQTESVIKRIIRQTIQTGSASSIIALCALVAFLNNDSSNVEGMFAFILEKVYVITLLANVNIRKGGQGRDTSFNTDEEMMKKTPRIDPTVTVDAIQVHRTVTVIRVEDDVDPIFNNPDSDTNTNPDSCSLEEEKQKSGEI
ncbi:hypothetical protein D9757_004759 [Collybiopsis confluens]|uniref:DUF6534 domain-containing protein n=1 Tax=Collybiopsis confluens TaxID=2823264 RepID=A0A8H5MC84_9AGAR|nr:hypothetical protein D9757_004759 [Collybiopsis confluens]